MKVSYPEVLKKGTIPTAAQIKELIEAAKSLEPVELPVRHHFSEGTYTREIFMPAGSVVVGKEHATRHTNIIISGECIISTVNGRHHLKGPCVFESMAGVQKALYMITDVVYMTVHPNPDNIKDEDTLERMFIRPAEQLELFPELNLQKLGSN